MKHKNLYLLVLLLVGIWTVGFAQNQCIQLNGTANYVVSPNTAALNPTQITVEGWVYIDATGLSKRPHMIGKGGSATGAYWLVIETTGEVRFYFTVGNAGSWQFATAGTGLNVVTTGVWHHYAGTYDGIAGKIYIDGVLKGTKPAAGVLKTNDTNPLYIGRSYATLPQNCVLGKIDEVRIWNYARTQTQISQDMDNEISPVPSSLIGYWKFNGNALDSSANNLSTTNFGGIFVTSDVTLPVELSSFTALPTAEYFVRLNWITQSETGVSGFRIYRGMTDELTAATNMNVFIEATNTTTTQVYTFVDDELEGNGTYYYWLENVDLDGSSNYYGPVAATVNQTGGGDTPPIELRTGIEKIYPNPFNPQTNIRFSLKNDAPVEVVIYNLRGQKVRNLLSAQKTSGYHNLEWNGQDNSGKPCASGVYTVTVKIGNDVYTRQMVMSK